MQSDRILSVLSDYYSTIAYRHFDLVGRGVDLRINIDWNWLKKLTPLCIFVKKHSERMRSTVHQKKTAQEFRESLMAHSVSRTPGFIFKSHSGKKVRQAVVLLKEVVVWRIDAHLSIYLLLSLLCSFIYLSISCYLFSLVDYWYYL